MKNKMFNSEKAITLVSLVITVVVMLILAGIIININDQKEGIIDVSQNKKEEAEILLIQETIKSKLEENPPNGNQELMDALKEYGTIENESDFNNAVLVTKDGGYRIQVSTLWNPSATDVGLNIGDSVAYTPETKSFKIPGEYSGTNSDATITLPPNGNIIWKVFYINKETKKAMLIPTNLNNMTLTLKGSNGYNNGVKILKELCDTLFSNNEIDVVARNMNIEDVEKIINNEHELKGSNYNTEKTYNLAKYPNIATVKLSNSKQDEYITGNTDASILTTKQTYYSGNIEFNDEEFKTIFKTGTYWLSSRAIQNGTNADFYISTIENLTEGNNIKGARLFSSDGTQIQATFNVLPVIEVDIERIIKEENALVDGSYIIK